MYRDTPNLFRVKFQIELEYDFVKAFNMFDDWYKTAKQKIQTDRLLEIYHQMEVSSSVFVYLLTFQRIKYFSFHKTETRTSTKLWNIEFGRHQS